MPPEYCLAWVDSRKALRLEDRGWSSSNLLFGYDKFQAHGLPLGAYTSIKSIMPFESVEALLPRDGHRRT